ncbi:MAG: tetratricopeptide repeat protein [Acidobacteriota bacterium]
MILRPGGSCLLLLMLAGCGADGPSPAEDDSSTLAVALEAASRSYANGEFADALQPSLRAASLAEMDGDPRDLDVARRRLAHILLGLALSRAAEQLTAAHLEADRDALGVDHQDTLLTQNSLAVSLLLQGRSEEARRLLEEALVVTTAWDQTLVFLSNLTYVAQIQADYESAQRYRTLAMETARQRPDEVPGGITWVSYSGTSPGGGTATDCSVFGGGTGPFNPDPTSGGPLSDCGPFGSDPIWGGKDDWWRNHPGGPGNSGAGGGGGGGGSGTPGSNGDGSGSGGSGGQLPDFTGDDGFDWGDRPLSDDELKDLPEGFEQDFNGCSAAPAGAERTRCCGEVRADCLPACELATNRKIVTSSGGVGDVTVNPFVCRGCRRAEHRCRSGKPL